MKTILFALLLLPASLFAADQTGVFAPGELYEPPADHAPAAVSRMFVRTVTNASALDIPAAGDSGMIIWTVGSRGARLTTPSGDVLRPNENGSIERGLRRFRFDTSEAGIDLPKGTSEVFHVMRAQAASYRLDADAPGVIVAAEPDSAITLESWVTPLSRQPGEPVTLHARLRDGEAGIGGATVTARLAPARGRASEAVALIDRGDGVYSATLADLPNAIPGSWQARFEADGRTASGVRFARTGSGELVAERGAARLASDSIRANVVDGVLRVTASADVFVAGNYRFDVMVAGAKDASGSRAALAWGEGARKLERGANALSIEIPFAGNPSDFHLDVRLLGLDVLGVAGRVAIDIH